ncbi:hypothetical protein, partial [Paenibacillus thiaminolyticus]
VWKRGKGGDYLKTLPILMIGQVSLNLPAVRLPIYAHPMIRLRTNRQGGIASLRLVPLSFSEY